jgi:hypothetical protein
LGHTPDMTRPVRAALLLVAFAATLALGGCGGVEFQGKLFDYMGLSGDHKEADVRMAERPPLLLPPNPNALPPPQNGVAAATARPDWPQNPEVTQKQVVQAQKDAKAKELAAKEPLHPYIGKPTLFDKWFVKDKGEQVDDAPEPDPATDKGEGVAEAKPKPLTPHAPSDTGPSDDQFHPAAPDSYHTPGTLN